MTQVSSAKANKLFNAALFTEAVRSASFTKLYTGSAPKTVDSNKIDARKQTVPGAPVTMITDLKKTSGDEVTVDLISQLNAKPVMGDNDIAGKMEKMKFSEFTLKINQGRFGVDSGGKMTQQRTKHDLKSIARKLIGSKYGRLADQLCLVHMAGARGDHAGSDWIIPMASDPDFAEILVNPLTPPTFERHSFGGDATSLDTLDSADTFKLAAVDNLRLQLDEMSHPLQPCKFEGDEASEDAPFYALNVTPRQWNDFWTSTDGATWRSLLGAAEKRQQWSKHQVFKGEAAMWHNILIRKQRRPIRFNTGTDVAICTNSLDAQTSTATVGVNVERAVLLGAQALADAYGMTGVKEEGGFHFNTTEEKVDHGNRTEHVVAYMNGKAKIRFKDTSGRVNDFGTMVLDTAVS